MQQIQHGVPAAGLVADGQVDPGLALSSGASEIGCAKSARAGAGLVVSLSRAPAQAPAAGSTNQRRRGRSLKPFGNSGFEALGVFLDAFIRQSNYYSEHVI
jgi:hypothetical protein